MKARCGEGTLLFIRILSLPVGFHETSIANTGGRSLLAFTAMLMRPRPGPQKSAVNVPISPREETKSKMDEKEDNYSRKVTS